MRRRVTDSYPSYEQEVKIVIPLLLERILRKIAQRSNGDLDEIIRIEVDIPPRRLKMLQEAARREGKDAKNYLDENMDQAVERYIQYIKRFLGIRVN